MFLSALLFCLAFFTLLLLYYFFKPSSHVKYQNRNNSVSSRRTNASFTNTSLSKASLNECETTTRTRPIHPRDIYNQISFADDNFYFFSKNKQIMRLDSVHSIGSSSFSGSTSYNNFKSSLHGIKLANKNFIYAEKMSNHNQHKIRKITDKLIKYKTYALNYISPFYKYLGLNDSNSTSKTSSESFEWNYSKKSAIEDCFK
jgi:hypothetical protein